MESGVQIVCQGCDQPIDPEDPALVLGVEIVDLPGFQQSHDHVEGLERLFHPRCLTAAAPRWQRKS